MASKKIKQHISEAEEQSLLFQWAMLNMGKYPELWFLHHIPNGGSRNKIEAANLKRQGVKAGVSDLFLPVARHEYHGLYIEMKSAAGKVSELQAEWMQRVASQGYYAVVAYGYEEAKKILEWYLR